MSCVGLKTGKFAGLVALATLTVGMTERELRVVPRVELARYMGRWYEIARYPNRFQSGLVGVIAEYQLDNDGNIRVINTGHKDRLGGAVKRSTARAWVTCDESRAKWHVQFIWPFRADYWIIDLGDNYEYAVVGQPSRDHLWVLSRTPTLPDETYNAICERLRRQGYDPRRLERTPQPADGPDFTPARSR